MLRRVLLALLVVLLVVASDLLQRQQQRVNALQERLGSGRGRGPRAPERDFPAVDVYANTVPQGDVAFVGATRFTRAQFDDLVTELEPLISANRHVRANVPEPSGEPRAGKLTVQNRLFLALRFLVSGGTCRSLSREFGLDKSAVSEELRHGMFALAAGLSYEIEWPTPEQMAILRGQFGPLFPTAIGRVDGTFTPAPRRPGDYSGHRHMTLRSHQIVEDAFGYIIHAVVGQIGSRHDSYNFARSDVPQRLDDAGVQLLADAGYIGHAQLIVPATQADIPDDDDRDYYNFEHRRRRSRIEATFGRLKMLFTAAGRRWTRCDRGFLALCVLVSCMLLNRVKRLRAMMQ